MCDTEQYSKYKVDQETINFVIQQVDSHILRNNIIVDLCERYGLTWQEAEELVLAIDITHKDKTDPGLIPFLPKLGIGVLIFTVIYFLAKSINTMGGITIQGIDLIILFAVIVALAIFIGLFLNSDWQNSIKESFRCPSCGYLANYKGNEDSIFTPRYEESTYYTMRIKLKTWREDFVPLLLPILSKYNGGWDEYSLVEITEFCRNCKQVRNNYRKVNKVEHRYPKDTYNGPY